MTIAVLVFRCKDYLSSDEGIRPLAYFIELIQSYLSFLHFLSAAFYAFFDMTLLLSF